MNTNNNEEEGNNVVVISFKDGKQKTKITITNDTEITIEFNPVINKDEIAPRAAIYALEFVKMLTGK